MKKVVLSLIAAVLLVGFNASGQASDWDKAGKALTIIEGLRLVTGGKVDFIGSLAGLNRGQAQTRQVTYKKYPQGYREKVWVPYYVWNTKYIPEHEEYSHEYGTIIVEGHYIRYRVERGGRWEWKEYSYPANKYRR
ncbi:MAG: hypothetical protein JW734_09720 [Candidatus Omnitrophica bacterium]|nr:hypothetical protein [Candidatus Omnitrophota bacterium]